MVIKLKILLNPDKEIVKEVRKQLIRTGGYCPYMLIRSPATLCMCEDFRAKIADMVMKTEAARILTYKACVAQMNKDKKAGLYSAMSKCFASDTAMEVTTTAVQVMGGNGYSRENPVEKYMRDAKIMQIYEGTNQVQRLVIANEATF